MTEAVGARGTRLLFAALPLAAFRDGRLSAVHFRVMGAIATYDCISQKGQGVARRPGCYASNKTLAGACGVHVTNFSIASRELIDWMYVVEEKDPARKSRRVLRIAYRSLPLDQCPLVRRPTKNLLPSKSDVCPVENITQKSQTVSAPIYSSEEKTENTSEPSLSSGCFEVSRPWHEKLLENPELALALGIRRLFFDKDFGRENRNAVAAIQSASVPGSPVHAKATQFLGLVDDCAGAAVA